MAFVLFVTGPSGSGKSTVAKAWADRRTTPTAVVDLDDVRRLIRAGRARPDLAWDDEAAGQWLLAVEQTAALARSFVEAGVDCVIDAYAPPSPESDRWDGLLAGLVVRTVHLDAPLEVCLDRNARRTGEACVTDEALAHNHATYRWCLDQRRPPNVIANAELTVAETVDAIDRAITVSGP